MIDLSHFLLLEPVAAEGTLDGVLNRLAEYLHRQSQIRNKVSAALAYPIVMLVIGVVIVVLPLLVAA